MNVNEPRQNKFHGLDHLRSLAIIFVLLFHYRAFFPHPEWFPEVFKFGWTGVDLFFVLSGFLIASQLFASIEEKGLFSIREFFIKRIFRILPIYYVVVAIYFFFPSFHEKESLPPLWKLLTFTQNIGFDSTNHGTFSHVWSLCIEEHFYLTLPLVLLIILKIKSRHSFLILPTLFIIQIALRAWIYSYFLSSPDSGYSWFEIIYYPTYSRLDGLLIGVSIAAFYQFSRTSFSTLSKYGNWLVLVGVLVLIVVYYFASAFGSYSLTIFGLPFIAIGYGLIVLGAISPVSFLFKFKSQISTWLATLSYGIYLIHKGIIHLSQDFFIEFEIAKKSDLTFALSIIMCLLCASLLNQIIEKPFLRMRKNYINKPTANKHYHP